MCCGKWLLAMIRGLEQGMFRNSIGERIRLMKQDTFAR